MEATSPKEQDFLAINNIKNRKKVGASIKFCRILTGDASVYARFDRLHTWDVAAGHLLIKEAGHHIIDLTTHQEPIYQAPLSKMNPFIVSNINWTLDKLTIPIL